MHEESREGGTKKTADPKWMPAHLETALRNGHGDAAIRRYLWLVERATGSGNDDGIAKARTDLGDAYAYVEQSVNALRQFKRAIKVCPKRAEPAAHG